jgi:hyperosmotically inducible protein
MDMRKKTVLALGFVLCLGLQTAWARPQDTDAQLQAKIQDKVYHSGASQHGQVTVTFENGVATLNGTVDNLGSRLDAVKAASKVAGVTSVADNIRVSANVTPEQMVESARKEIVTYYAYGIFDNVRLEAQGSHLIVTGEVTQPYKKSDLGHILAHVTGVAKLDNNLEVLPNSPYDDHLRWQLAHAIYGTSELSTYAIRPVPPIHIIVKNGNVTLEGAVGNNVDLKLAEMKARTTGLSFSVTNNLRVG